MQIEKASNAREAGDEEATADNLGEFRLSEQRHTPSPDGASHEASTVETTENSSPRQQNRDNATEGASDVLTSKGSVGSDGTKKEKENSWFPSGDSSSKKQNQDLVDNGTIPDTSFSTEESDEGSGTIRGWIADQLASKDEKQIFNDYNKLAKRVGHERLTDSEKLRIENLPQDMLQMYRKTLDELVKLEDGQINSAQYMANTLINAADLAEANGRSPDSWNYLKPSQEELFKNYLGLVMSEPPMGVFKDAGRELVGGGPDMTGSTLELTYQKIIADGTGNDGFNPNVTDVSNTNSVTHHFREFLLVGYNSGKFIADKAATAIDDPKTNPGDVRDGYFAGMIGAGLANGDISAREAADLTIWAYTKHGGTQPPWGATHKPGEHLDRLKDYDVSKWLKAFRASDTD